MDDMVIVVCLVCGLLGFIMGSWTTKSDIIRDCTEMSQTRTGDMVIECKVRK